LLLRDSSLNSRLTQQGLEHIVVTYTSLTQVNFQQPFPVAIDQILGYGIRNAGFNLLEMPKLIDFPGGLNSWMGFASRWGGVRALVPALVENGIRLAIPASLAGGAYGGYKLRLAIFGDE
jgi:hypothetical protein